MNKLTEEQKIKELKWRNDLTEIVKEIYNGDEAYQYESIDRVTTFVSSLLQKEREAGKREGIEMINEKISILQKDKALYKNRKDNDFYVVRIGELASLRDELKSQSVEKGNDFKFDKKGNSIP